MTDAAAEPANDGQPTVEAAALAADAAAVPEPQGAAAPTPVAVPAAPPSIADERPELVVGAAFAGGLVLALFLKRLAR
jgi:hypothetical protein